ALPALTTTPREMADALERVAGPDVRALIDWTEDPAIRAIVETWPARFVTARAAALGLQPEPDFDAIIGQYVGRV
ncbi:NAD-dependent epimerase, partial [Mesorhizobium japonicum]